MKQVKYTIHTLAPVLISSESGNQFMVPAKDYIPGLNVLGALAAKYIKREGQPNYLNPQKPADTNFYNWFVEGGLSFSNAYKVDAVSDKEKRAIIPLPFSVHHIKNKEKDVLDLLYDHSDEQTKPFGGFGLLSGDKLYKTKISKSTSPHHERDYITGAPKNGIFFNYESIDANQEFEGTITGKEELLNEFYNSFKEINQLRIGRSRTSEYGKVKFHLSEISDITSDEISLNEDGIISLTFLSNIIIYNDYGYPSCSYKDLEKYIEKKLPGTEILKAFLRTEEVENYISVWKLKKPSEVSFQAGSCLLLKTGNENTDRLKLLQDEGIGERKHEGFGRIVFGLQEKQGKIKKVEFHKKEYKKPGDITIPVNVTDAVKKIAKEYLQKEISVMALNIVSADAEKLRAERKITSSQISRLEGIARISNSEQEFKNKVKDLRKISRDKLNACDIDNTTLFSFLTERTVTNAIIPEKLETINRLFNDVEIPDTEITKYKEGLYKTYYLTLFAAMRKALKGGD